MAAGRCECSRLEPDPRTWALGTVESWVDAILEGAWTFFAVAARVRRWPAEWLKGSTRPFCRPEGALAFAWRAHSFALVFAG
jgi:hypothetical protein